MSIVRSVKFRSHFVAFSLLLPPALLLSGISLWAQGTGTQTVSAEQAGRDLAATLANLLPVESSEWHGTLKIRGENGTKSIPVIGQTYTNGPTGWKMTYLVSAIEGQGAEQLTVVHTTDGANRYLYAQAPKAGEPLADPKALNGAQADVPLAGSDFWLSDLGFEFYHWPVQRELKGETRHRRACHVLESINPDAKPGSYTRVKSWIDRESGGLVEAQAFTGDDRLIKEFELSGFQKVKGHWELKEMQIQNRETDSRTRLEFDLKHR